MVAILVTIVMGPAVRALGEAVGRVPFRRVRMSICCQLTRTGERALKSPTRSHRTPRRPTVVGAPELPRPLGGPAWQGLMMTYPP